MRRRWSGLQKIMTIQNVLVFAVILLSALQACDCARRGAQRRTDNSETHFLPSPSEETLSELAEAMGAAGFEAYTEGKALVKRLIPQNSEPDLDSVDHQGVIGKPGIDFPAFPNIPQTGFNCKSVPTGYYADLETDCQVFHICDTSRKISFLCPNGTIFSQSHLICDWWFKVDCASAPALYESSAEYYSAEQKKTQKVTQILSKNADLQQISSDTNIRSEPLRKATNKDFAVSTTERFLRHKQRLHGEAKPTSRSYQPIIEAREKPQVPSGFEKRRKLVQLIDKNFSNSPTARTTLPTYTDSSNYRNTEFNSLKEMQVAAESASFANGNNRQYLQDLSKNYRPFPVYNPNQSSRAAKSKPNPTLTTLFVHDITNHRFNQHFDATTKRPTLLPYTKSYTVNDKREPYTRPGVSLLKDYLNREKNKTSTTTERITQATDRSDYYETATKIPKQSRSDTYFTASTSSPDRYDAFSSTNNFNSISTEASYQERRERLMRKLNLDNPAPTEATVPAPHEEYGKRPGLIVPPSLTPKTLHTLAIYYATALDNLSTTSPPDETAQTNITPIDDYDGIDDLPALFSRHTINKYSKLFNQGANNAELLEEIKLDTNGTYNDLSEDLSVQQSQNPFTTSPQIRELAQVFTHALSAYLQDPVQFRKVLSDIRPTHPSFAEIVTTTDENIANTEPTTTINEEDAEILGFSDDIKSRPALAQVRDGKSLNPSTVYPVYTGTESTTPKANSEAYPSTAEFTPSTARSIFRCCGRISASYTTASSNKVVSSTFAPPSNTIAADVNTLSSNNTEKPTTTTESDYLLPKYGGFQNNSQYNNPYGADTNQNGAQPLNEYVEITNLPTAWGVDATSLPIANAVNQFESKKIKPTTYSPATTTPVYFTETDSVEFENEEELQRAHSQSFVSPQDNNTQRQGKTINFDDAKAVKRPSEDLEAPTISNDQTTTAAQTTAQPTTTQDNYDSGETTTVFPDSNTYFTSPGNDKNVNDFQWSNHFDSWQSTVILDPITLNDGLTATGPQDKSVAQSSGQTTAWAGNTATSKPFTTASYTETEQDYSSSQFISYTTPANYAEERKGKALRQPTSTESTQDLTTIAEAVVEKAKEIMGEMNSTTTEKLMNVMKKTKSKTVRRLILLLVQTCDDDHNSTAEASKRALLEALMAVSQKDMDEVEREQEALQATGSDYISEHSNDLRRTDHVLETQKAKPTRGRSGKSLDYDPSVINSLSNTPTVETTKSEPIYETTVSNTTPQPFTKTTPTSRRGTRKFLVRTSPLDPKVTKAPELPKPEARVAPDGTEIKSVTDTRAIELLRSLYTIAARWG